MSTASVDPRPSITETISITVGADVSPSEAAKVCRQVMRVLAQLVSNVLTEAANKGTASAGHPAVGQMYTAAVNAEAAANSLDPPRVSRPGMMQMPPGGGPMGRA
jgi:hypothetical protein